LARVVWRSDKTSMAWGFSHGDGWFDLVWGLCEQIEAVAKDSTHFKVSQVKQEFGGLTFLIDGEGSFDDAIMDRIKVAERRSYRICEECGQLGLLRADGLWKALCEDHADGMPVVDLEERLKRSQTNPRYAREEHFLQNSSHSSKAATNMKKELELKFRERWPEWFADLYGDPHYTCMSLGFTHGDGWFDLVWRLCERIEAVNDPAPFKVEQVKEKFGCLRFYTNTCNELIQALIEVAEDESLRTCEVCGQPGAFRKDKCQAMCDRHANEANQ
jgi:hypothetical protein